MYSPYLQILASQMDLSESISDHLDCVRVIQAPSTSCGDA